MLIKPLSCNKWVAVSDVLTHLVTSKDKASSVLWVHDQLQLCVNVCACLACMFMHFEYVHLFQKAHQIQLKNSGWHHVIGKWCQLRQRPKWVEGPLESGFRGISAQKNGNLIRAKPSTTVSKTVSYSMVSPSIKTNITAKCEIKWPFPCANPLSHAEANSMFTCSQLTEMIQMNWTRRVIDARLPQAGSKGVQQSNKDSRTFHFPLCPF